MTICARAQRAPDGGSSLPELAGRERPPVRRRDERGNGRGGRRVGTVVAFGRSVAVVDTVAAAPDSDHDERDRRLRRPGRQAADQIRSRRGGGEGECIRDLSRPET